MANGITNSLIAQRDLEAWRLIGQISGTLKAVDAGYLEKDVAFLQIQHDLDVFDKKISLPEYQR